jgi:hypothetical protein
MLCIQVEGPRVTDMGALSRRVVLATKQEQGPVFARRAKRWTCMLSCRIPGSTPYGTPITTVEMSNAWAVRRRARLVIGHGGLVGRDAGPVRGQPCQHQTWRRPNSARRLATTAPRSSGRPCAPARAAIADALQRTQAPVEAVCLTWAYAARQHTVRGPSKAALLSHTPSTAPSACTRAVCWCRRPRAR